MRLEDKVVYSELDVPVLMSSSRGGWRIVRHVGFLLVPATVQVSVSAGKVTCARCLQEALDLLHGAVAISAARIAAVGMEVSRMKEQVT
jgi:hypothetical protein